MNLLKTLGLTAVLTAALGTTDAQAEHRDDRHRHDRRPRGGISIVIGQPGYPSDCYSPYYRGYDLRHHPRYRPYPGYHYPSQGSRVIVPLGRDIGLSFELGKRNCRPYVPLDPYSDPYYGDEW